jgi:hypothetical protein
LPAVVEGMVKQFSKGKKKTKPSFVITSVKSADGSYDLKWSKFPS